jgi:hypothetical protein
MLSIGSPSFNLVGFEIHIHLRPKQPAAAESPGAPAVNKPEQPQISTVPRRSDSSWRDFDKSWWSEHKPGDLSEYLQARHEFGRKHGLINRHGFERFAGPLVLGGIVGGAMLLWMSIVALSYGDTGYSLFSISCLAALVGFVYWSEREFRREFGY